MDKQTDIITALNKIYEKYQKAIEKCYAADMAEDYVSGRWSGKSDAYKSSWQLIATAVLGTRHDAEPYNITGV